MRDKPADITECRLSRALAAGWRLRAADLRYAAVGGGSNHWTARDDQRQRWFVTVDDLDARGWLGRTRPAVFAGLRSAMDTALALRRGSGLRFVAAPVPALDGATIRPLGSRYSVAVFPFLDGDAGRRGEGPSPAELVDTLAALHQVPPATVRAPGTRSDCPTAATWTRPCATWACPGAAAPSPNQLARCWPAPPASSLTGWRPWTG